MLQRSCSSILPSFDAYFLLMFMKHLEVLLSPRGHRESDLHKSAAKIRMAGPFVAHPTLGDSTDIASQSHTRSHLIKVNRPDQLALESQALEACSKTRQRQAQEGDSFAEGHCQLPLSHTGKTLYNLSILRLQGITSPNSPLDLRSDQRNVLQEASLNKSLFNLSLHGPKPSPRKRPSSQAGRRYEPVRLMTVSFLALPREIRDMIYEECLVRGCLPLVDTPAEVWQAHLGIKSRPVFEEQRNSIWDEPKIRRWGMANDWLLGKGEVDPQKPFSSVNGILCYAADVSRNRRRLPFALARRPSRQPLSQRKETDPLSPEILYLNRQIYYEALPYLYLKNTFGFNSISVPCEWSAYTRRKRLVEHKCGKYTYEMQPKDWSSYGSATVFLRNLLPATLPFIQRLYLGIDPKPFEGHIAQFLNLLYFIQTRLHLRELTLEINKPPHVLCKPMMPTMSTFGTGGIDSLRRFSLVCYVRRPKDCRCGEGYVKVLASRILIGWREQKGSINVTDVGHAPWGRDPDRYCLLVRKFTASLEDGFHDSLIT